MSRAYKHAPALVAVFLFSVYLLTAKGHTEASDSVFSLRTTQSIVERASFAIEADDDESGWVYMTPSGTFYSKYGIGLPLLWVPYGLVARMVSPAIGIKTISLMDFLVSFNGVFFAVAACIVFYHLVLHLSRSISAALVASLILGLCTMCWRYAVSDCSEIVQMFFLLSAAYGVLRNSRGHILAASLSCAALILIKVFFVVYLPVYALSVLMMNRAKPLAACKRMGYFMLFPACSVVILMVLNYLRFNNPLETGYGHEAMMFSMDNIVRHMAHILFSSDDGMLFFSPVLAAGLLGYAAFFRSARIEAIFFASLVVVGIVAASTWHAYQSRLMVPLVPLMLAPVYRYLLNGKAARVAVLLLAVVSCFWQVVLVMQPRMEYEYGVVAPLDAETARQMPSKARGALVILKHRITGRGNAYRLSEFGVDSDRVVEVYTPYGAGPDIWYCYLAKKFGAPVLYFVPLLLVPFIIVSGKRIYTIAGSAAQVVNG